MIVASGVLTACVPIIDVMTSVGPVDHDAHQRAVYVVEGRALELVDRWKSMSDVSRLTIIEGQRPYGDFAPGRWAWLFDELEPTRARCPWCWGNKWEPRPDDRISMFDCRACNGQGACEPIPARGAQKLWEWSL